MFVAKIINILSPYAVILSPEPRVSITTCPFKIISYGLLKVETIDNKLPMELERLSRLAIDLLILMNEYF